MRQMLGSLAALTMPALTSLNISYESPTPHRFAFGDYVDAVANGVRDNDQEARKRRNDRRPEALKRRAKNKAQRKARRN